MLSRKSPTPLLFSSIAIMLLLGLGQCYGQDSIPQKKNNFPHQRNVLLIKKTQPTSGLPTEKGCFRVYYRVQVVSRDSSFYKKGRIKYISDSSIFLKSKEIKLKNISSIKKCGGKTTTIVGGSILLTGAGLFAGFRNYYDNKYYPSDYEGSGGMGPELASFGLTFIGGITTLIGGIQWATARNYDMTEGKWKFEVYSEAELSNFHKAIPKEKKKND
jgi:hypothetical protein